MACASALGPVNPIRYQSEAALAAGFPVVLDPPPLVRLCRVFLLFSPGWVMMRDLSDGCATYLADCISRQHLLCEAALPFTLSFLAGPDVLVPPSFVGCFWVHQYVCTSLQKVGMRWIAQMECFSRNAAEARDTNHLAAEYDAYLEIADLTQVWWQGVL